MKKITKLSFAAIAALSLFMACSKAEIAPSESTLTPSGQPGDSGDKPVDPKVITFTASLEDLESRVSFTPSIVDNKPTVMALLWEAGDQLHVMNHSDRGDDSYFALVSGAGTKEAIFSGTLPGGSTYDVEIVDCNGFVPTGDFTIDENGSTLGLKYLASATGIAIVDDETISLTDFSSVLSITAKMPSQEVAAAIQTVNLTASEDIFFSGNSVTIAIETPGSEDQYLHLYATLPKGTTTVPAGTTLMAKFNAPFTEHTVYTRYMELSATTFDPQTVNNININAEQSDLHAGISKGTGACDGTTAEKAYLIADKYQMDAMHTLMERATTKYFKLIENIDMSGIVWFPLNNGYLTSGGEKLTGNVYDRAIDFNGNGKTISNLTTTSTPTTSDEYASIFGVLMGKVYNLTIDNATVYPQRKSAILAGYVGTGTYGPDHCEVSNVTIKNSSITNGGSYCGIVAAQSSKAGNIFSNITVTDCTVSSSGLAGGAIAYLDKAATISDVAVSGTNVTSNGRSASGTIPDDGIAGGIAARVNAVVDFDRCNYSNGTVTGPRNSHKSGDPETDPNSNIDRYIGGLFGYLDDKATTIDDCHASGVTLALEAAGTDNNARNMGGAIGGIGGSNVVVGNSTGCTVTGLVGTANLRNYVGGFIGYNIGGIIKNSSAAGSFTARGAVAGFVGHSDGGTFNSNSSSVTVAGAGNVGGFAGSVKGETTFTSCSATGDVSATGSGAGGFVGTAQTGSYSGCSASGNVTSTTNHVGGFAGKAVVGSYSSCFATGKEIESSGQYVGGFVGETDGALTFDGCYYDGSASGSFVKCTNSGSNNYLGGFCGYVYGTGVDFSECYVKNATIVGSQERVGGFFGQNSRNSTTGYATTDGCYVKDTDVTGTGRHVGGFVGVLYSAITDSYVDGGTITATGTDTGGFAGYGGNNLTGCYASATVAGGTYQNVGGLIGTIYSASTISNCYSSGTVTGKGYQGGLIGNINVDGATVSDCHSTATVTSTGGNFVGGLIGVSNADMIEKCYYDGTVTGPSRVGGILGIGTKEKATTIRNCYSRGAVVGAAADQRFGGIVGDLGKGGTVTNCWSDATVNGGRVCGGIVGLACYQTWADATVANNTVTGCIAWNPEVKSAQKGDYGSSAAIVGHTSFKNTLANCYRRSDMDYSNSNNTLADCITAQVDQPNCDGTNWVGGTTPGTTASTNQNPYYGVAAGAGATVSSIAQTLGWDGNIWDFTGDLPTLK